MGIFARELCRPSFELIQMAKCGNHNCIRNPIEKNLTVMSMLSSRFTFLNTSMHIHCILYNAQCANLAFQLKLTFIKGLLQAKILIRKHKSTRTSQKGVLLK
uniref:Uncharacterized protein n=1 Tax=Arundo donax TaxID=35708 RepID=A0A0A9DYH4_ARUDO